MTKTVLTAIVLAALPALASAQCYSGHKADVVLSCAPGTVYDTDAERCVPTTG